MITVACKAPTLPFRTAKTKAAETAALVIIDLRDLGGFFQRRFRRHFLNERDRLRE